MDVLALLAHLLAEQVLTAAVGDAVEALVAAARVRRLQQRQRQSTVGNNQPEKSTFTTRRYDMHVRSKIWMYSD